MAEFVKVAKTSDITPGEIRTPKRAKTDPQPPAKFGSRMS
jgi:hypothetical protein